MEQQQFIERKIILEVNFLEKLVYFGETDTSTVITEEVWNESIIPFLMTDWHDPDKDEIEFFIFYNNNTYFCQKRRKRLDYATESFYWQSYQSSEKSFDQAKELYDVFNTIGFINTQNETEKWLNAAETLITENDAFFRDKWSALKRQINEMLAFSDWRVLPDIEEKYEGEVDLWIKWRNILRNSLPDFNTFSTAYEAFKFCHEYKFPVDPKNYLKNYPNREVEYLSTDDQYKTYSFQAASDYTSKNIYTIQEFINTTVRTEIKITNQMREVINKLKLNKFYPDLIDKLTV